MNSRNKNKILIVDDDSVNLRILREILAPDYEVKTVENGGDAIAAAKEFNPDIILLDIVMRDMDGYEACRKFRESLKLSYTKIIMLSAKNLAEDRIKGYEAGADDYVTKPFNPDELLAKIKVFIGLKSVQEIDRLKSDFINLLSHETKTPLNTIIGFARVLSASERLDQHEKECVNHIISSAASLLELVNKSILLTNLKSGKWAASRRRIPLESVLDKAMAAVEEKAREKNLVVAKNLENCNPTLNIDEELVVTALAFIIENAIKYSPYLGMVELVGRESRDEIFCDVRDVGKGLGKDTGAADVFTEFYVEDIEHHGRGHGLSLVIVRHIMQIHGGRVTAVNNENGRGCTFTLSFPRNVE